MLLNCGYSFSPTVLLAPTVLCALLTGRRVSLHLFHCDQIPLRTCQRRRACLLPWPAFPSHVSCTTYYSACPNHRTPKGCRSTRRRNPSHLQPRIYQRRPFLIAYQKHFNYGKSPGYISAHGFKTQNTTFHIRKHRKRGAGVPLSYA